MTEGMSLSQLVRPTINMNNTEVGNNPNDKNSSEEYFDRRRPPQQGEEEFAQSPFVDRSAQLRATLNSLAALNAANIVRAKDKYRTPAKNEKFKNTKQTNPIENNKNKDENKKKDN